MKGNNPFRISQAENNQCGLFFVANNIKKTPLEKGVFCIFIMTQEFENLKNNQMESNFGWGGARIGAGRKEGISAATLIKKKFKDFLSEEDMQDLVNKALEMARNGSKEMVRYVLDQCLGKAVQCVDIERIYRKEESADKNPLEFTQEEKDDYAEWIIEKHSKYVNR